MSETQNDQRMLVMMLSGLLSQSCSGSVSAEHLRHRSAAGSCLVQRSRCSVHGQSWRGQTLSVTLRYQVYCLIGSSCDSVSTALNQTEYRIRSVTITLKSLLAELSVSLLTHTGRVQLASDFGKRLRAAISCHLRQTSKESAQLKINITSLTDVNKNSSADDKLLCHSDCYYIAFYYSVLIQHTL